MDPCHPLGHQPTREVVGAVRTTTAALAARCGAVDPGDPQDADPDADAAVHADHVPRSVGRLFTAVVGCLDAAGVGDSHTTLANERRIFASLGQILAGAKYEAERRGLFVASGIAGPEEGSANVKLPSTRWSRQIVSQGARTAVEFCS